MNFKLSHIILLLFSFTVCSCIKSPEEKAQTLFEESIKLRMGNPDQYEFIQMTNLDSAYSSLEIDRTYLNLKDSLESNRTTFLDILSNEYRAKRTKEKDLEKEIKEYEQLFTSRYIGWHSKIEFRAENLFGGRQIYVADVYFDENLTKCLDWFIKAE